MRHYCLYILLVILIACNAKTDEKRANPFFGQITSYKTPGLAVVSTRTIKELDNDIHGVLFMSNTGKNVSKDTLSSLLYTISKQDIINRDTYETYKRTCNSVDILTWKSNTHKNVITRVEKIFLKAVIPLSDGGRNIITVTDFDIYSINKPNHVALRVINDYELEYLKIDEVEYTRIAESIPVGLHIAIAKADSARNNACR